MTFEEFTILAKSYNVIPVSRTLLADTLTPVSAYLRLRQGTTASFLFESVEGGERFARYSFIGREPEILLTCHDSITTIQENGLSRTSKKDFFEIIHGIVSNFRSPKLPQLPRFSGGLVGYIGYDAIRFIEQIPASAPQRTDLPDSILGLFNTLIVFDHFKHHVTLIVNVFLTPSTHLHRQYDIAQAALETVEGALFSTEDRSHEFHSSVARVCHETSHEDFIANVQKAQEYILEGNIFQVVLSQRFSTEFQGDIFNVYRALRLVNPSPYLYFLDFHDKHIIGSSPEILVRVEDGIAEVYPIAGTRARGKTFEEDKTLEQELLTDEKERAEHIMLVDLGRNDLGRVCKVGTVRVDQLMSIVRYSHVMHIASRVVGKISPGVTSIDVLKATFPAGTVSGAPKIRAMEIIDELEKSRRGLYAGGVGYFDFSGNMDMCIAIRTMFTANGRIYLQAGAGIVADSDPEKEYQETMHKARALIDALTMAEGVMR